MHYKCGVTLQNQKHSNIGHCIDEQLTRRLEAIRCITRNCFTFQSEFSIHLTRGQVFIMNERVNKSISQSILHAARTGKGFNKTMRTGNGLNKVTMYILPSKQKRKMLFEATRTCVWLKLDVCSMCVRFATQL